MVHRDRKPGTALSVHGKLTDVRGGEGQVRVSIELRTEPGVDLALIRRLLRAQIGQPVALAYARRIEVPDGE